MSIHNEHRKRTKEKYEAIGIDAMHDHEVLELLLFYGIPRGDVNPVAHELMNNFGNFHKVLEASPKELKKIKGLGDNTAILFRLVMDIMRRYGVDKNDCENSNKSINTVTDMVNCVYPHFFGLQYEKLIMLSLDHKGIVTAVDELSRGTVDETNVSIRSVVEIALLRRAHAVILAHNHPSGTAVPSAGDVYITQEITKALRYVSVQMLDHIVLSYVCEGKSVDDNYTSMRKSHLL